MYYFKIVHSGHRPQISDLRSQISTYAARMAAKFGPMGRNLVHMRPQAAISDLRSQIIHMRPQAAN